MSKMSASEREQYMIMYCLENEEHLDEWEQEFIHNISELPVNKVLTARQSAKLKEIFDKL